MAKRSRRPHSERQSSERSSNGPAKWRLHRTSERYAELSRALRLAAPFRIAGYAVLLFEFAQRALLAAVFLLCGWAALLFYAHRHPRWATWAERPADALLLIQGTESALLAALIWLPPLPPASALLLSAALLLANGALGGARFLLVAAASVLVAVGPARLSLAAPGPGAPVPDMLEAPVAMMQLPGLLAFVPALALFGAYGISFSVLGYGRVRRLKRRQKQQHQRLLEQRARAERLQRYLPHSLAARLASPSPSPRQRCWLLIAYVDLCDFTPLTARLEADALAEVLDGYLTQVHRLAETTDGIVAKVLGDGVLLFWQPIPCQEQGRWRAARQALQFARALPQQLRELSEYWQARGEPLRLAVRAALTSGYCTLGDWGTGVGPDLRRLEYTVIGTPVNLAARLQSLAEPGGVVVDERTRLLLRDRAAFDGGRIVTIRGLGEQRIYELGPEGQRNLTLVR